MSAHESNWTLRRLHAGELPAPEAARVQAHVGACEACAGTLQAVVKEQAEFEAQVSFERFEAGVEQARARQVRAADGAGAQARWVRPLMAVAATVLVVVLARPLLESRGGDVTALPAVGGNRIKGGATAELRIGGGSGPQRVVDVGTPEALRPDEAVRLAYTAEGYRYVAVISVDAQGEVSPLYPEEANGESLAVAPGAGKHWLPDSVGFTGTGVERVVLVLTEAPLSMPALSAAAKKAFTAADGDVTRMGALDVAGSQMQWVLLKP
jgi:anti-sigma factor RsiW